MEPTKITLENELAHLSYEDLIVLEEKYQIEAAPYLSETVRRHLLMLIRDLRLANNRLAAAMRAGYGHASKFTGDSTSGFFSMVAKEMIQEAAQIPIICERCNKSIPTHTGISTPQIDTIKPAIETDYKAPTMEFTGEYKETTPRRILKEIKRIEKRDKK